MPTKKGGSALTISYRDLFFFIYFAIMFGMRMWGVYEGTILYGPMLIIGFAFWGMSVLMTEHTVFEYIVMAAFIALAGVVYLNTGEKGLLLYFTLMLGMKNVDVKKLFGFGAIVGSLGMACLTFLTSFGFVEDAAYIQERRFVGLVFRHSLGMPHPSTLSSSFAIITVMIMYVMGRGDRKKVWKTSALMAAVALYLFIYSGSRTGILITWGFLALNLVYTYRENLGIVEKLVAALMFPIIWIITIALPVLTSEDTIERLLKIDNNLMVRLLVGKSYLQQNSITLFGSRLVSDHPRYGLYGIDLSQLYLLLNLGLVAFVVVTALTICLVICEIRENMIPEFVITVLFFIMGVTDPFLYNLSFKNICFAFMGLMVYRYLGQVSERLPGWMNVRIFPVGIGNRKLKMGLPGWTDGLGKQLARISAAKREFIVVALLTLATTAAVVTYCDGETPSYVLADRNTSENIVIEGLEGRKYTQQEIRDIEDQGNIVLNYTDEDELMFVYYSDEENPVEGGFYARYAPLVEKVRKSISVFFWGTFIAIAFAKAAGVTAKIKRKQGQASV